MEKLLSGLKAAGEATRLRLLVLASLGELTVKDITWIVGQSQPRISRHLKLLTDSGLLSRYREGSWVYFRLAELGAGASLARAIVAQVRADDPVMARDKEKFGMLRDRHAEEAAHYFRANAASWDAIRSLHVPEARVEAAMRKALGKAAISTLLDLGTGTGRILELFSDRYRHGIGIDSSQEMLSLARDKLTRSGHDRAQVRHGDIYHLPYDDGTADVVVFHQVLHYLDDPRGAIAEAGRVLVSGGRMLIVDFAPHELDFLRAEHAHLRLGIAPGQMAGWLEDAGLKPIRHEALPPSGKSTDGLTVLLWLAGKPDRPGRAGQRRAKAKQEAAS